MEGTGITQESEGKKKKNDGFLGWNPKGKMDIYLQQASW